MYLIAYQGQGRHDGIFVDFDRGKPNDLQRWFSGFSQGVDVDVAR